MTKLSTICPTPSASARLSVVPLARSLPRPPHLVAPGHASRGDFLGIFGGICYRPDLGGEPETLVEVAYRQGLLGPENFFINELSDADAATMREITANPYGGIDHHRIARQALMVDGEGPYQIHLVQFSDAILYVHPLWLQGIWGQRPDQGPQRPLMIMMEGARSMDEAERCLEKTKKYMKTFRMALPARTRANLNLRLELPRPEDFLANGGADHAFVR